MFTNYFLDYGIFARLIAFVDFSSSGPLRYSSSPIVLFLSSNLKAHLENFSPSLSLNDFTLKDGCDLAMGMMWNPLTTSLRAIFVGLYDLGIDFTPC